MNKSKHKDEQNFSIAITTRTFYVRDAQGNVMGIYKRTLGSADVHRIETPIYGSSRLGVLEQGALHSSAANDTLVWYKTAYTRELRMRSYELTDHLGNVRATVSDLLIPRGSDVYDADVRTLTDYHPFGMQMPERTWAASGVAGHRYGFNGKENDNEVKGEGNSLDFGARIYDPRVGRFMSVDPSSSEYHWQTPYAYHRNSPIFAVDWQGYGDPPFVKNNVMFIHFKSPTVTPVNRSAGQTFAEAALRVNTSKENEYVVNMQMYELLSATAEFKYGLGLFLEPNEVQTQGLTVHNGAFLPGGRPSDNYYVAQSNGGSWSAGLGNPPLESKVAFGGGIPLLINGMPFGKDKKYDENGKTTQNSSNGYPGQNIPSIGKTILAFNDKGDFMIVSQPDGVQGMTLDNIKANLQTLGYTNAVSFDGSTSATLVKDGRLIHEPSGRKNNSIPVGAKVNE